MEVFTASVEFHELAQGYRAATPDGAQAAYDCLCAFVEDRESTLRTIIATKNGEIAALTAEVTHLAEKLAERDAAGVDRNSDDGLNGGMHDSIFVKVWGDTGGGDDGRRALAQYAYNIGFADHAKMRREIDDLVASIPDDAAPQPVDAAQAVPDNLATIAAVQSYLVDVVRAFGDVNCAAYISNWHKPEQIAVQIAQPTDTTKGA